MVHEFVRRLTLSLRLALKYLIAAGSSFPQVNDHVRTTERACIETYGDSGKKKYHQYNVSGISFGSRDPPSRDQYHL